MTTLRRQSDAGPTGRCSPRQHPRTTGTSGAPDVEHLLGEIDGSVDVNRPRIDVERLEFDASERRIIDRREHVDDEDSGRLGGGAAVPAARATAILMPQGESLAAAVRLSLDQNQLPKPLQIDALANDDWRVDARTLSWQFVPQPEPQ